MNYAEAIQYIENRSSHKTKAGLERMREFLIRLGNPHKNLKFIHIAGTNGKGSTCAMLSSILISSGYKVGIYTSPHLDKYNERITINNTTISDKDFINYTLKLKPICDDMENSEYGRPTVFEILTAIGFCYFYDKNVDFVVLEVGLGGRFDATNIIENSIVSCIASISFDHTAYLGSKLSQIAFEKGGIIKKNCPVVLYSQSKEVYNVIKDIADKNNSKLYFTENAGVKINYRDLEKTIISIKNQYIDYENIEMKLIGNYQPFNCAFVLLICTALRDSGVNISDDNIYNGIKNAKWNGRMEILSKNPTILIDGAHNIDGISMLSKSLSEYFSDKTITLVLGVLGDKEYEKMIELIIPMADRVVITEPHSYRKLDIQKLEQYVSVYNKELHKEKDIEKAIDLAKNISNDNDVIVCAGSLYMVGEIRKILK